MVSKTLMIAGASILAALAPAAPAAAQQPPPAGEQPPPAGQQQPPPPSGQQPPSPPAAPQTPSASSLSGLDANRDGSLDRMEFDAGAAAAFAAADRNNDGRLSVPELGNALRAFLGRAALERRAQPNGDNRERSDRFEPNRPQVAPRFRGPEDQRRFQAPYYGPRFQAPYWWHQRPFPPQVQPYGPRFQAPYPPRLQAPPPRFQAPTPPQQPGNRDQSRRQQPQAPQAAPTPPGFAAIDRNRDGVITPDEFSSAFGRGPRGR
jgi:hypothetical protein